MAKLPCTSVVAVSATPGTFAVTVTPETGAPDAESTTRPETVAVRVATGIIGAGGGIVAGGGCSGKVTVVVSPSQPNMPTLSSTIANGTNKTLLRSNLLSLFRGLMPDRLPSKPHRECYLLVHSYPCIAYCRTTPVALIMSRYATPPRYLPEATTPYVPPTPRSELVTSLPRIIALQNDILSCLLASCIA